MSHPPECEITRPNGRKCTRWVEEPGGAHTAKKTSTANGPKWVCAGCLLAARRMKRDLPQHILEGRTDPVVIGERIGRNDPCPCGCGRKAKRCKEAKA